MIKLRALAVLLTLIALQSSAVTYSVGYNDTDCDFDLSNGDTLQGAIDFLGTTELRLVNNVFGTHTYNTPGAPFLITKPITISGGYHTCADANNGVISGASDPNSYMDGMASNRVLIINSSMRGEVVLKYLTIQNGTAGNLDPATDLGGGIYIPDSNKANVILEKSQVSGNGAYSGGGIYFDADIQGTLKELKLVDTTVRDNTARNQSATPNMENQGGGIYITGGLTMNVSGDSLFQFNQVESTMGLAYGGGLYASNAEINLFSATDYQNHGFINNQSEYRGAGIYLDGDVVLNIYGHPVEYNGEVLGNNIPYNFALNFVDVNGERGGAIYSFNSSVNIEHSRFFANQAATGGGAIVNDSGQLYINAVNPENCWREQGCNLFENNGLTSSAGGVVGGAILTDGASLLATTDVKHSFFTKNRAISGTTMGLLNGAIANMESVIIYKEGSFNTTLYQNVIYANSSSVTLKYVSGVENDTRFSIFRTENAGSQIDVYNSIFYNPEPVVLGVESNGGINSYNCLLSDDSGADLVLTPGDYASLFVDPINLDFRLLPGSLAIDMCDNSLVQAQPTTSDMQGYYRGYDDISVVDFNGIYDAGANEYNLDYIFVDSFE